MDANTILKYKTKSYSVLHDRAVYYFNKFIRLRDTDSHGYGRCISSGQSLRFGTSNAQAGHYYSAGQYKALEFNEDNVHLQGKSDNYFNSSHAVAYRKNLIRKIGEKRVEQLDFIADASKFKTHKNDRFAMIEIIEKYKKKCKDLAKTKMFEVKI